MGNGSHDASHAVITGVMDQVDTDHSPSMVSESKPSLDVINDEAANNSHPPLR